jgi:hypothetical protein
MGRHTLTRKFVGVFVRFSCAASRSLDVIIVAEWGEYAFSQEARSAS